MNTQNITQNTPHTQLTPPPQQEGFDELQKRQKATFIKKQKRKKQCSPPS